MKKIIAITIALITVVSFALPSFAMSINEGVDNLRTLWSRGNGPEVDGLDIDYSYYSPVENGAKANKKYPLVIIMAGALEGVVEGFELTANALASWTADEYQSKFHNGGAFLLIGRAPEEDWHYWDSSDIIPAFKAAIDDFVSKNPNVDTSRIYTLGWCLGGNGSINLATLYPDFFAAAVIICPNRAITKGEAKILKDKPVWLMGCKRDTYVSYLNVIVPSWNRLKAAASDLSEKRLTTCAKAPGVTLADKFPFIQNHNMWSNVAEDMQSKDPAYVGLTTVDGEGNSIINPSIIDWLSSKTLSEKPEISGSSPGMVHKFFNETIRSEFRKGFFYVVLHLLDQFGYIDLY